MDPIVKSGAPTAAVPNFNAVSCNSKRHNTCMLDRDSLWLIVISRANRDLEEHQAINYELCMILSRLSEKLWYYVGCCQSLEQSKQT